MSNPVCREGIKDLDRDKGSHAGLLLDRYLHVPMKEVQDDDSRDDHASDRKKLLDSAVNACKQSKELYESVYERYESAAIHSEKQTWGYYKTKNRIVINLSQASVLETAVALHHTYGVPYLPSTSLKGLTAHYCHKVVGPTDREFLNTGKHYEVLFGTEETSGHILFHDGWIRPESLTSGLTREVMTPHHGDYYSGNNNQPPTDFDSPKPVTYLALAGTFLLRVSCDVDNEQGVKWAEFAMRLLDAALQHWGVGGKTNAGYGRLRSLKTIQKAKHDAEQKKGESNRVTATQ